MYRSEACSSFDWSSVPYIASNSFDIAKGWSYDNAWRGDSPRLRTARNSFDIALLAKQMGLNDGKWYELGVLGGKYSSVLLTVGEASSLTMVDLW